MTGPSLMRTYRSSMGWVGTRAVIPAYTPHNHQVEAEIQTAVSQADYQPFETLLDVVTRPFEERAGLERFALPPELD